MLQQLLLEIFAPLLTPCTLDGPFTAATLTLPANAVRERIMKESYRIPVVGYGSGSFLS